MSDTGKTVTWKLGLAYGLPNFGMAIMVGPVLGIIQGIYARDFGVAISAISGVIFAGRLFDAVSDPVVGILSDKYRKRFWGRRSWIVVGAALSLISIAALFMPPGSLFPETAVKGGLTEGPIITYLYVFFVAGFLGWTICEIPYLAWGTEITSDYDQRTKLFSYKTAIGYVGAFVFVALPIIIGKYNIHILGQDAEKQTADFNPFTLKIAMWMLLILMPLFIIIALKVCPDGTHVKKRERHSVKEMAASLFGNRAMLIFTSAFALIGLGVGMQIATGYLYLSVFLGLAEYVAPIYICGMLVNILGVPIWNWAATKASKHVAFMVGAAIMCVFFVGLGLLQPVGENPALYGGKPVGFWLFLVIFMGLNICQAVYYTIPPALMGDVAQYGLLKTGQDQSGTYYSLYTFVYKTTIAIGNGAALYLVGKFGFDAKAETQTETAAWALRAFMGFLPAALVVIAIILLFWYPLSRKRYAEVEQEIERKGLRTSE